MIFNDLNFFLNLNRALMSFVRYGFNTLKEHVDHLVIVASHFHRHLVILMPIANVETE